MASSNRHLQQQVKDLQAQLQTAIGMQSEATVIRQRNLQLEQQNTDLQQQLQAAARAWADKHRQHKETLSKAQASGAEALAENKQLHALLKGAQQVLMPTSSMTFWPNDMFLSCRLHGADQLHMPCRHASMPQLSASHHACTVLAFLYAMLQCIHACDHHHLAWVHVAPSESHLCMLLYCMLGGI